MDTQAKHLTKGIAVKSEIRMIKCLVWGERLVWVGLHVFRYPNSPAELPRDVYDNAYDIEDPPVGAAFWIDWREL